MQLPARRSSAGLLSTWGNRGWGGTETGRGSPSSGQARDLHGSVCFPGETEEEKSPPLRSVLGEDDLSITILLPQGHREETQAAAPFVAGAHGEPRRGRAGSVRPTFLWQHSPADRRGDSPRGSVAAWIVVWRPSCTASAEEKPPRNPTSHRERDMQSPVVAADEVCVVVQVATWLGPLGTK